jgi:hypothetical protein
MIFVSPVTIQPQNKSAAIDRQAFADFATAKFHHITTPLRFRTDATDRAALEQADWLLPESTSMSLGHSHQLKQVIVRIGVVCAHRVHSRRSMCGLPSNCRHPSVALLDRRRLFARTHSKMVWRSGVMSPNRTATGRQGYFL